MPPKKQSPSRLKITDLNVTEGDPSASAEHAYISQNSDIEIGGSILYGLVRAVFKIKDMTVESPLHTAVCLFLIALIGVVPAALFNFLGFPAPVSGASAAVTWVAAVVILLVRHRRR